MRRPEGCGRAHFFMNVTSGAPPWPEGLSLRKLPIPGSSFARCIGLIWTRASLRLRLVQAFLELAATDPAAPKANTRKPKGYVPNSRRGALLGHHRGTSADGPSRPARRRRDVGLIQRPLIVHERSAHLRSNKVPVGFRPGQLSRLLFLARLGPAEVLAIRQLSGGKQTDLKRAALSRFVRTHLDIVPRGHIRALLPINALPGSEIGPWLRRRISGGASEARFSLLRRLGRQRARTAGRLPQCSSVARRGQSRKKSPA